MCCLWQWQWQTIFTPICWLEYVTQRIQCIGNGELDDKEKYWQFPLQKIQRVDIKVYILFSANVRLRTKINWHFNWNERLKLNGMAQNYQSSKYRIDGFSIAIIPTQSIKVTNSVIDRVDDEGPFEIVLCFAKYLRSRNSDCVKGNTISCKGLQFYWRCQCKQ